MGTRASFYSVDGPDELHQLTSQLAVGIAKDPSPLKIKILHQDAETNTYKTIILNFVCFLRNKGT